MQEGLERVGIFQAFVPQAWEQILLVPFCYDLNWWLSCGSEDYRRKLSSIEYRNRRWLDFTIEFGYSLLIASWGLLIIWHQPLLIVIQTFWLSVLDIFYCWLHSTWVIQPWVGNFGLGVRSLVVERRSKLSDHPQAHFLNNRTMEVRMLWNAHIGFWNLPKMHAHIEEIQSV